MATRSITSSCFFFVCHYQVHGQNMRTDSAMTILCGNHNGPVNGEF